MSLNLSKSAKVVRVINATVAGATAVNGGVIDTQGYESVEFAALFGTLTATQVTSLKAQESDVSDGTGMNDLAGTSTGPLADGDGNKVLILEVIRPLKRYVRCVVVRGTANAVIDGVIAILHRAKVEPVTLDASISASKTVIQPAEGTA